MRCKLSTQSSSRPWGWVCWIVTRLREVSSTRNSVRALMGEEVRSTGSLASEISTPLFIVLVYISSVNSAALCLTCQDLAKLPERKPALRLPRPLVGHIFKFNAWSRLTLQHTKICATHRTLHHKSTNPPNLLRTHTTATHVRHHDAHPPRPLRRCPPGPAPLLPARQSRRAAELHRPSPRLKPPAPGICG